MVITVKHLVKKYEDLIAINDISFEVKRKEVFAFLGPNGAGKTTTVEILECLRDPTSGVAEVLGYDVSDKRGQEEIKNRIGVLPQDFSTFDLLNSRENLQYYARMYGNEACDIDALISLVGLDEKSNALYKTLSGGLKRRLAIAITLVNDPEVVFLDEPTSALDPKARREIWTVLEGLRKQGKTIFLTTHYMEEAEALANNVCILDRGKIVAEGSPADLITKYGGNTNLILKGDPKDILKDLPTTGLEKLEDKIKVSILEEDSVRKILGKVSRSGMELDKLEITKPSLEDVFLKLTGKRITDEGTVT
ncbi:MAG: ATP-binding cassette domain-containing protein [Nitrososphaerales archaeon]